MKAFAGSSRRRGNLIVFLWPSKVLPEYWQYGFIQQCPTLGMFHFRTGDDVMGPETNRDRREPEAVLPGMEKMLSFVSRVIGVLMVIATLMFAFYLVIEWMQAGSIRDMVIIRASGTTVLAICTFVWMRARSAKRFLLGGVAGLVFTTTISVCTTLATYYSHDSFEIAMGYGLVIAVLNVILWRSVRSLVPGLIGALVPPIMLMVHQRPPVDVVVNYVSLVGVTVVLTIAVFIIQQAVLNEIVTLHAGLVAEAGRDDLTGMRNRRCWSADVSSWEQRHPGGPFSILFLDLDNFKRLNDSRGHDVGDQALIDFAILLQSALPEDAIAARFGGDEFVVFLPGPVAEAHALSDVIKIATRESALTEMDLTVSVGIAEARAGSDRRDLLREADHDMFARKLQLAD